MSTTWVVTSSGIVLLLLAGCADTVPTAYSGGVAPIKKVAFPGKPLTVYYFYSVHPDCTQSGSALVEVTYRPHNGSVEIQHNVEHYPEYPLSNARYRCNTQKVPSEAVIYTSRPGFIGADAFSVRAVYTEGGGESVKSFKMSVENPPKP
jgi:hypothetical protein